MLSRSGQMPEADRVGVDVRVEEEAMGKYVVDLSVVLHLLSRNAEPSPDHQLLAPTLLRDKVLAALYESSRTGELPRDVALDRLARFSKMKIRYLGDKVLRRRAWAVAEQLDWGSTDRAEYIALAQLQGDALITLDADLAAAAADLVETTGFETIEGLGCHVG